MTTTTYVTLTCREYTAALGLDRHTALAHAAINHAAAHGVQLCCHAHETHDDASADEREAADGQRGISVDVAAAIAREDPWTLLYFRVPSTVTLGIALVETMPDCHRASHRAAGNWGSYPDNGAEREWVSGEDADAIVADDEDGYASIVRRA